MVHFTCYFIGWDVQQTAIPADCCKLYTKYITATQAMTDMTHTHHLLAFSEAFNCTSWSFSVDGQVVKWIHELESLSHITCYHRSDNHTLLMTTEQTPSAEEHCEMWLKVPEKATKQPLIYNSNSFLANLMICAFLMVLLCYWVMSCCRFSFWCFAMTWE